MEGGREEGVDDGTEGVAIDDVFEHEATRRPIVPRAMRPSFDFMFCFPQDYDTKRVM